MAARSIVAELTDRCNLTCGHCLPNRHGGATSLPIELIAQMLGEAPACGFDRISYTGGEPTMHPQFAAILRMTAEAGLRFGMVTNGWNFPAIYPRLLEHRSQLSTITFSMDGATAATHDGLRGEGSFLRLMRAFSVCTVTGIPFSINMVLTAHNRHETEAAVQLAAQLGSRGIRFGHLMPSPEAAARGLLLAPAERNRVDAGIRLLQSTHSLPVALAPGFHTEELFPCDPLEMREINVDCHGYVSKCCHLSGHGAADAGKPSDRAGRLGETGFAELVGRLREANHVFRGEKQRRHDEGRLAGDDYFPCLYCAVEHGKLGWLPSQHAAAVTENLVQIGGARADGGATS